VDKLPLLINRDECRTPFQWDSTPNAGFSTSSGTTWLPVNKNFKRLNLSNSLSDSASLYYTYQKLLKLKHSNPCIQYGTMEIAKEQPGYKNVLVFSRVYNDKKTTVIINFSGKAVNIPKLGLKGKIVFNTHVSNSLHGQNQLFKPFQGIVVEE
jgi:glycosidase